MGDGTIETAGPTTATARDPSRGQIARGLVWRWLLERDGSATDFLAVFGDYNGLVEKRAEYARAGIGEYWIVDPKARDILVRRLDAGGSATGGGDAEIGRFSGDDVVTAEAAPDVPIRVADVFARAAAGDSATR